MPRYSSETVVTKAAKLTRDYFNTPDLCKADVARKRGVSRQAITKQINKLPIQKIFAEYLKKDFNHSYLRKKLKEGLEANKINRMQKVSDKFVRIPDMHCRHKYLVTILACLGYLKYNEDGMPNISLTINNIKQIIENANRDNRITESSSSSGDVEK